MSCARSWNFGLQTDDVTLRGFTRKDSVSDVANEQRYLLGADQRLIVSPCDTHPDICFCMYRSKESNCRIGARTPQCLVAWQGALFRSLGHPKYLQNRRLRAVIKRSSGLYDSSFQSTSISNSAVSHVIVKLKHHSSTDSQDCCTKGS